MSRAAAVGSIALGTVAARAEWLVISCGKFRILVSAILLCIASDGAQAAVLCPDGRFVKGPLCDMAPDGHFVSGTADGTATLQIAPDGHFVGGVGEVTICPDGSFTIGECQMMPDGHFR